MQNAELILGAIQESPEIEKLSEKSESFLY